MENPKLKPEQYWEWRFLINEMYVAEEKLKIGQLQLEMMNKDLEICRLRASLFKNSLQSLDDKKGLTKKDYLEYKERLENELGVSLNNKVIDDISFEVRELENEQRSN